MEPVTELGRNRFHAKAERDLAGIVAGSASLTSRRAEDYSV
jgi:hypothetical protein